MTIRWAALSLACGLAGALSACARPLPEGAYVCEAHSECPPGWYCRSDRRCWITPDDASTPADAGSTSDSSTDAPHDPATGDACEEDCTLTCTQDSQCADGNACNGNETCDVAAHICVPAGEITDCDDTDPCTTDSCVAASGCSNVSVLVDADGDGHPAITASCGGDDCDDGNAARHPGATEPCGASMDSNCDGSVGVTPIHYRDCDADGYAATTTDAVAACVEPAPVTGCSGGWTTLAPGSASTTDCLDTSIGGAVHPGQTRFFRTTVAGLSPEYDYDCNGSQQRERPFAAAGVVPRGLTTACEPTLCTGDQWYVGSSAPLCGSTVSLSTCTFQGPSCLRYVHTTAVAACR